MQMLHQLISELSDRLIDRLGHGLRYALRYARRELFTEPGQRLVQILFRNVVAHLRLAT
jgi:hypothetical protein